MRPSCPHTYEPGYIHFNNDLWVRQREGEEAGGVVSKQERYKSDQGPSVINHSAVKNEEAGREEGDEEEEEPPRAQAAACVRLAGLLLTSYCGHFYISRRHDGGSQVRSCASVGAARSRLRRAGHFQQRGGRRGVDDGELAGKEQKMKNK